MLSCHVSLSHNLTFYHQSVDFLNLANVGLSNLPIHDALTPKMNFLALVNTSIKTIATNAMQSNLLVVFWELDLISTATTTNH